MTQDMNARFRPSLIIFVDEVGEQIGRRLQEIASFARLDPVLCQCIALLQVQEGGDCAKILPFPMTISDEAESLEEEALERAIERSIRNVQDHRRLLDLSDSGYAVSIPITQIYIVGNLTSPWLGAVLRQVHNRLRKMGLNAPVCYVLSSYQARMHTGALPTVGRMIEETLLMEAEQGPAMQWEGRVLADFCYLYEDMLLFPYPMFVQEIESHHAAAEGLFALISTAIMTDPRFIDTTSLHLTRTIQRYENVGTLSICQIIFPYMHLLEYCSAMLGVTLMDQWLADMRRSSISDAKNKELRQRAKKHIGAIEHWINDPIPRPRKKPRLVPDEEYQRPTLDVLKLKQGSPAQTQKQDADEEMAVSYNNQIRFYTRLKEAVASLFELFDRQTINREVSAGQSVEDWTRVVYKQASKAVDEFSDWERAAIPAWDAVGKQACMNVKDTVDHLWSQGATSQAESGFELARIYIEEVNDQLAKTQNRYARLRIAQQQDYQRFLDEFTKRSEGPWGAIEEQGNILGASEQTDQASPTMGGMVSGMAASTNTNTDTNGPTRSRIVGGQGGAPAQRTQHLLAHEEDIAHRLELRIHWYNELIPTISSQCVASFPLAVAVSLAMLAIVPSAPFVAAVLILVCWALIFLACWYERFRRKQKVEEAKKDLIDFYRGSYVHRCELYEDQLRLRVTGPLRRQIHHMSVRLNDIHNFMQDLRRQLQERAQNIEQALFDSPSASRNIFVANGERIQRERNSPSDFAQQLTSWRMSRPIETWHQEDKSMQEQLVALFLRHHKSLLEIDTEAAFEQVYTFAETITQAYFKGPLVDIQYALDKQDIWREAFDRARNPLYRTHEGIREPGLIFVCGRAQDLVHVSHLPPNTYQVRISDAHQWVLIAAFFRGAVSLDADLLFPYDLAANNLSDAQDSFATSQPPLQSNDTLFKETRQSAGVGVDDDGLPPPFNVRSAYDT